MKELAISGFKFIETVKKWKAEAYLEVSGGGGWGVGEEGG